MDQPPTFDPADLASRLARVGGWSQPSQFAATGVHHGYRQVTLVQAGRLLPAGRLWADVLNAFAPVGKAWLSWIDPGGFILPHRDAGPWLQRWQVPIVAAGSMCQGEWAPAQAGVPFRVAHWEPHSVANRGSEPRVHLVLDRDVPDGPEASGPFEVFDVPADLADLLEAALIDGGQHAAARS